MEILNKEAYQKMAETIATMIVENAPKKEILNFIDHTTSLIYAEEAINDFVSDYPSRFYKE